MTAVLHDENPEKDGQKCDIRDIVTRRNVLCLTVPLNQLARGTNIQDIDRKIHAPEILQTFSLVIKSMTQYNQRLKKTHIFKIYL